MLCYGLNSHQPSIFTSIADGKVEGGGDISSPTQAGIEIDFESLNCQQILLRKGLLYRDYKVGVIPDTCVLQSDGRSG